MKPKMTIKTCPYCSGNQMNCDYCDDSGLMDLSEIARAEDNDKRNAEYAEEQWYTDHRNR